jgi:hypothetical protein
MHQIPGSDFAVYPADRISALSKSRISGYSVQTDNPAEFSTQQLNV